MAKKRAHPDKPMSSVPLALVLVGSLCSLYLVGLPMLVAGIVLTLRQARV